MPIIPAPTIELTKLLQAPAIPDFFFGKERLEICRLGALEAAVEFLSTSKEDIPRVSLTASRHEGSGAALLVLGVLVDIATKAQTLEFNKISLTTRSCGQ